MEKKYVNRHRQSVGATIEAAANKALTSKNEWKRMEIAEGEASVSVSISVGRSESYGTSKYSVTVNHSVSCGQDAESKENAFQEASSFCMAQIENLEKDVINQFFPNNFKESK